MLKPAKKNFAFSSIDEIIQDFRDGKMVIIVDDEDRENEGDLIMAASKVQTEDVNYMARYGRGLVCLTLTRGRCKQLRLPLMVSGTDESHTTNFTVSIEAAKGITTGISAHDRARTVRVAVAPDAEPGDLRQPGHVFPLMAQPGGVLTRAGHTEAGCDLARLAGFEPAAMIVEILNDDGTMARRPQLEVFAQQHGLKIGSIADLIRYRIENEQSVEQISRQTVSTEFGDFELVCFEDHVSRNVHLALVKGDLSSGEPPLVRVHLQNTLGDVVGINNPRLGWPLRSAMQRIANTGHGVVVILRYNESPSQLATSIQSLSDSTVQDLPADTGAGTAILRTYGTGAQLLRSLGITKMRVLSAPKQMHGISGFGLEVVEYVDEPDG
ncbi:MAG: bifunctional 3,4-dihydroxy-2-butanone-4-phosphate synthase/GTP cyclohydrolase II [Gammaproteobacteria bacterium]|jgi:3,4-dihydroxy 2-butanone 4-phosphate synthase/GTP cyclohydrolase II|nr:3,4-dihydroxy-2-butanone-4-phosphate synthase [Chromatiales bacterium]MDP6675474.1 bifunctional 3,4-dihydroxy-2-butanone-4-phosphate synthase/GTP cyclohydrolase II [Gammaproteobacteria bacterium]